MTESIPFDKNQTPTLYNWHVSQKNFLESNLKQVKDIETSSFLYPKNSKIRKLMHKVASLQCELGEIYNDEVKEYQELYPNLDTTSMLKLQTGFPWKGIAIGAGLSFLNISMSNYRHYEAKGKMSSLLNVRSLGSRGGKLLAMSAVIVATCASIDYFYMNNFSGYEMNHLHFLEWCKAYRVSKCQLEF